jgi:CheY-like chemotaxis protein
MPEPEFPPPSVPPYFLPSGVTPPPGATLPLSGLTLLLVEDSRYASDVMRLMCQRSGARLRRAESQEQARAHLRTYRPDVVIIDLGLPDGRGDRLIRELVQANMGSVILGISGDPDGRGLALAAGAQGHIDKPIENLAAFQRAVLKHLPQRFAVVAEGADWGPTADPLALQDDLHLAAGLLSQGPDMAQQRYVAGFLGSLALTVGDAPLAKALHDLGGGPMAVERLQKLVSERLSEGSEF